MNRFTVGRSFSSKSLVVGACLAFIVLGAATWSTVASANVWDARGAATAGGGSPGKGYFSNVSGCVGHRSATCRRLGYTTPDNHVLPVVSSGQALTSGINSVPSLMELLKRYNGDNGGSADSLRKKAGSAFIAQTMLGRNGDQANANGGRNISAADWVDLEGRLNDRQAAGKINWNVFGYCAAPTTFTIFKPGAADIIRDSNGQCDTAIIITNDNGNKYALMRSCANPTGEPDGIQLANNFSLTPSLTSNVTAAAEPGNTVDLSPVVDNGGATSGNGISWQLSTFTLTGAPAGAGDAPKDPLGYYGNGLTSIGSGSQNFAVGSNPMAQSSQVIPDKPIGTKVCYALSVHPYNQSTTDWRHSTPVCIVIAKKPKLQILGGDLSVGRGFSGVTGSVPVANIKTSTAKKDIAGTQRMFGSWIEYGMFATSSIIGAGSGSAYADPGLDNPTSCRSSFLSFANAGASPCDASTTIGSYNSGRSIPDIATNFPVTGSTPSLGRGGTINLNAGSLQGLYTATGNVAITGGGAGKELAKGQWIVINAPSATVTITGNIHYTSAALQSIADIPQLVIIAKNIIIADNVTNVDAWLVAKGGAIGVDGVITTCSSAPPLTSASCKDTLTINGPVMAQRVVLYRTAGSGVGTASGDPAEVFNLRPDAYLWGMAQSSSSGRLTTTYERELPPRF